jgi:hypothetical protein
MTVRFEECPIREPPPSTARSANSKHNGALKRCRTRPHEAKDLAEDERAAIECSAESLAYAAEILDVTLPPVREGSVSFTFDRRVLLIHVVEPAGLDLSSLDVIDEHWEIRAGEVS